MIKIIFILVLILIIFSGCQVAGKNPEDLEIPVIQPTASSSYCNNDQYPLDAPKKDSVDTDQYSKNETSILGDDGNALSMNLFDIVEGNGTSPTINDLVTVHYAGWLEDGCLFDASYLRGTPSKFLLVQVINGWRETLQSMKVGGRRRVEIPPELAYGIYGKPPVIPGNATLTFDIKLIDVLTPEQASATATVVAKE